MHRWPRLTDHERALVRYELTNELGWIDDSVPQPIATIADALDAARELQVSALALLEADDIEGALVLLRGERP